MKERERIFLGIKLIINTVIVLACSSIQTNAITKESNKNGNWNAADTWSPSGVPAAGDDVVIKAGHTVTVNGSYSCASLNIGDGNGTASLTFSGTSPSLTVSGSVSVGASGNANRRGILTFTSGSVLTANAITLYRNQSNGTKLIMTAGGTLMTGSIAIADPGGGGTPSNPEWTPGSGTVVLTATNTLPASVVTSFNNLTVSSGTTTLGTTITLSGVLNIESGATLNISTRTLTINAGATLLVNGTLDFTDASGVVQSGTSGTSTLTIGSTGLIKTVDLNGLGPASNASLTTQSGGSGDVSSLSTNGTVEYYRNATSSQTITDRDYNNLTITGSAQAKTWTLTADRTVNGNLTVNPGAPFTVSGTQTIILKGNWTNNGVFTAGTSTIIMNGTSAQTMYGSTFNNLTIDNSAGVTLLTDERVNGTLTLTNGRLTLGAYNLTLGPSASISGSPSASSMIVTNGAGELRKEYSGTGSFTFPVGDNNGPYYTPATINVTSGSFSSAYVGVRVKDVVHPNIFGTPSNYLKRYWTVTSSGLTSFQSTCSFTYNDADIVGNEAVFELGRYTSSWTSVGSNTPATNTLSGSSISEFGEFTGAEPSAVPVELTSFSGLYRNGRVTLSWRTATEANNYGFEVQVSHDSEYWTTIGFVEGHGTVNTPQNYSFDDGITEHERSHGTLSYRLRQVDRDGSYSFSPVIKINVGALPLRVSLFQNYPNPFNPETNIAFILPEPRVVSLIVFNSYGREVRRLLFEQEMGAGQHVIPFQTQSLPSGAYVYKLITPEGTMNRVMTISK